MAQVPYRNLQGETFLRKSHQIRGEIPFREYLNILPASVYPGKHELWLIDQVTLNVLFAGPMIDGTAGSDSGVISFSCQDPQAYLAKRFLKTTKTYVAQQGADIMVDLIAYVNSIRSTNIATNKVSSNATTANVVYTAASRQAIVDLIADAAGYGDGTDYYFRSSGTTHTLNLYGGLLRPTVNPRAWEYGGVLQSYSLQINGAAIANDVDVVGSNGLVGNATDATSISNNNALYQDVITGSNLTAQTDLTNAAALQLKSSKNVLQVPSVVVKDLVPMKDFDLGDQFQVVIDDGWAQFNQVVRIVGWQMTVGQGDNITTVVYINNLDEVT